MFIFTRHEMRFNDFLAKDKTHPQDIERIALFYILAGNDELAAKVESFYDFDKKMIEFDTLEVVNLSSSAYALLKLAFNLYNNFECGNITEIFIHLDQKNRKLALNAIKMRFKVE